VCVFEHGANYYAPTLVYTGALTGWTHVAVVYQDAQPRLFLNGEKVHTGIKSEHVVHSGVSGGATGGYRGRLGTFVEFPRSLSEGEVRDLMKSTPQPVVAGPGPALSLERRGQGWVATAGQNGRYNLQYEDGQSQDLVVTGIPSAQVIEGSWEVSFTPGWGAPDKAVFHELVDWTKRQEDGIRFYSGKAIYRKTLQWQPGAGGDALDAKAPVFLDLGEVRDVATVRLNGREIATLWLAPYRVDVADWLRPGANVLEIEVINPWNNRVVGDLALPVEQRHTFILAATIKKDGPLLPAGLLGPVSLQATRQYRLPDHRFK